jgi:TPP-dependent pyruvate/acetoin dehydrogenase alpha subunit
VNTEGQITESPVSGQALADFAAMLRIRLTEEAILTLRLTGPIVGSVHLSNGQEAIPVGVVGAREEQDVVFATYRGHGWALACGLPVAALLAEACGRASGVNGGRGGSAYLSAPDHGFYGENSIVGAGVPIAVGAALAARYDGSNRVAVAVFGDGALNQGSVHEAMNMASAFGLPVVFVCENNGYSELTPIESMVKDPMLNHRAKGYGFRGVRVDGNDPTAVRSVAAEALDRARGGGGPTLIEAMTQRIVGHMVGDAERYRPFGELDAARNDEPLARMRRQFIEAGMDEAAITELERPVRDEVRQAIDEATAAPFADESTALDHLYG